MKTTKIAIVFALSLFIFGNYAKAAKTNAAPTKTVSNTENCEKSKFVGQWEITEGSEAGRIMRIYDSEKISWDWKSDRIVTDTLNTPNSIIFYSTPISGPAVWKNRDIGSWEFNLSPKGNACLIATQPYGTITSPFKAGAISYDGESDQISLDNVYGLTANLKRSVVSDPDQEFAKNLKVFYRDQSGLEWGTLADFEAAKNLPQEEARALCQAKNARLPTAEEFRALALEFGSTDSTEANHKTYSKPKPLYAVVLSSKLFGLLSRTIRETAFVSTYGTRVYSNWHGIFYVEEEGIMVNKTHGYASREYQIAGTSVGKAFSQEYLEQNYQNVICVKVK